MANIWIRPAGKGGSSVPKKTIGIVGTRRRDSDQDLTKVYNVFKKHYRKGDTICSGLCPQGADRFAIVIAHIEGCPTLWLPAQWHLYGRGAGFVRNTDIAKNSDILIACVASDRKGGTEDTIKKFIKFHGAENLIIVD
jgi:hypothetical protein